MFIDRQLFEEADMADENKMSQSEKDDWVWDSIETTPEISSFVGCWVEDFQKEADSFIKDAEKEIDSSHAVYYRGPIIFRDSEYEGSFDYTEFLSKHLADFKDDMKQKFPMFDDPSYNTGLKEYYKAIVESDLPYENAEEFEEHLMDYYVDNYPEWR